MPLPNTSEDEMDSQQVASKSIPATIAPWWHTALLLLPILGFSLLGNLHGGRTTLSGHHVPQYLLTLGWEWLLAAMVLWGIRMRRVPLRQLLGERRPQWHDWRDDFLIAAVFWIAASIILAAVGILLNLAHLAPQQKVIAALAPQSGFEFALWIALSLSAGICEELIFRGYLLQQFSRASQKLWVGVLASSFLFGIAHGYEGAAGMIAITLYGALFCILTVRRRSLRPGMMAHAWHDIFTGAALVMLRHMHVV